MTPTAFAPYLTNKSMRPHQRRQLRAGLRSSVLQPTLAQYLVVLTWTALGLAFIGRVQVQATSPPEAVASLVIGFVALLATVATVLRGPRAGCQVASQLALPLGIICFAVVSAGSLLRFLP